MCALDTAGSNVSTTARTFDMERTNLHKRIRALGLSRRPRATHRPGFRRGRRGGPLWSWKHWAATKSTTVDRKPQMPEAAKMDLKGLGAILQA